MSNKIKIINKSNLKFFISLILVITLFLVTSCQEEIDTEQLEDEEFILNKNTFDLEKGQRTEFLIGINNKESDEMKFDFFVQCVKGNCEDNIVIQFFPNVKVKSNSKIALPLSIEVMNDADEGDYEYKLIVKKERDAENNEIFGEDTIKVNVRDVISERKEEFQN